jgi:hypothetical protein
LKFNSKYPVVIVFWNVLYLKCIKIF